MKVQIANESTNAVEAATLPTTLEGLKKGDTAIVNGYSMQGTPVKTRITFVTYLPEERRVVLRAHDGSYMLQDCIVENRGLKVISDSNRFAK